MPMKGMVLHHGTRQAMLPTCQLWYMVRHWCRGNSMRYCVPILYKTFPSRAWPSSKTAINALSPCTMPAAAQAGFLLTRRIINAHSSQFYGRHLDRRLIDPKEEEKFVVVPAIVESEDQRYSDED